MVARAIAADAYGDGPEARRLTAMADAAEQAPRAAREVCENELSAELSLVDPSAVPPALVAELADAESRVLLARRFHNDAVRDTLALRERRPVRWLKLGEEPRYQRISRSRSRLSDESGVGEGDSARRRRRGAVVLRFGPGDSRWQRTTVVVHRRRRGSAGESLAHRRARTGRGDRATWPRNG